jgi:hypothetical protein
MTTHKFVILSASGSPTAGLRRWDGEAKDPPRSPQHCHPERSEGPTYSTHYLVILSEAKDLLLPLSLPLPFFLSFPSGESASSFAVLVVLACLSLIPKGNLLLPFLVPGPWSLGPSSSIPYSLLPIPCPSFPIPSL